MAIQRRDFIAGMSAAAAALAQPLARAQAFPSKPVRIVVPYAAGGITDILSRMLAQHMESSLGQRVLVENKAGAAGILGTEAVAKAAPDGYTILMGSISPLVIAKIAADKLPYDPFTDFSPVTQVASSPVVLVVHPSVPAQTAAELVELIKAKPDAFNFSSAGAGAPSHLACELLKRRFGLKMAHIPYKGTGASLVDLVAGQVQLTMDSPAPLLPFIRSGKLRALAVASPTRSPLLPDVPTMNEAGLPGVDVSGWYGYLVPAKTPAAVVERIHAAIGDAVRKPEVSARIVEMGAVPLATSPQQFAELMRQELQKWSPIVQSLDLKLN